MERSNARALYRHGEGGTRAPGGEEFLDASTQRFERESLALRTKRGVAIEAFESLKEIAHLVDVRDGRVTIRPESRLVANQVIVRLKSGS